MKPKANDHELVEYSDPGQIEPVSLRLDAETQTIWATQSQIAQLFDTNQQNVSYHLKNIFADGELAEDSNTKNMVLLDPRNR